MTEHMCLKFSAAVRTGVAGVLGESLITEEDDGVSSTAADGGVELEYVAGS